MVLPPEFQEFLAPFAHALTAPTFQNLLVLVGGWLLARRHSVTGALKIARPAKHFSAYHRVFSRAPWDPDLVGLAFLKLVLTVAAPTAEVDLILDDSLARHRGWHIYGAGMHFDPLLTGRKRSRANRPGHRTTITSRGHNWVVLAVAVTFPFYPGHVYALPILFRLHLNRTTAAAQRRVYRTKVELGREMLDRLGQACPDRAFHLLTDSAYAGADLLGHLPKNCQLTARWILNAALYAPAPPKPAGKKGPPRKHGERLPGIDAMLAGRCERLALDLYGTHGAYRVATVQACFYQVPAKLLRIVAVEPLTDRGHPKEALRAVYYSTCVPATPAQVLLRYARRWSIEVTFRDLKQELGLAQPPCRTRKAVERTAPTLGLLYGVVVVWFATTGQRHWRAPRYPWYRSKARPSFADMLTACRQQMLKRRFRRLLHDPTLPPVLRKPLQSLLGLWKRAA